MNPIIAKRDIGLMIFIIAVCVAVLAESWDLPPGTFEPLGSGPIPQAIAFAIIGLCLIILVRAFITLARHSGAQKTEVEINLEAEEKAGGFRQTMVSDGRFALYLSLCSHSLFRAHGVRYHHRSLFIRQHCVPGWDGTGARFWSTDFHV